MKLIIYCVVALCLCSCATIKDDKDVYEQKTKYDISIENFNKEDFEGIVQALTTLPTYIKHNVLNVEDNIAFLTYTTKGGRNDVVNISNKVKEYLSSKNKSAEIVYTSGMFKITRKE